MAHGQGLGDAAIPFRLQAKPCREVNAESDLIGHGGSGVLDDGLDPLARLLVEAVQPLDGDVLPPLAVWRQHVSPVLAADHFAAVFDAQDAATGQYGRIGSPARISQLRQDLHQSWREFHGETFKRDRLGRPDSPLEMMVAEEGLRRAGILQVGTGGDGFGQQDTCPHRGTPATPKSKVLRRSILLALALGDRHQANRLHKYKGIYLDDALSGDDLERPGLQSLIEDFHRHNDRSHLFRLRSNIDWVTVRCRPWCIRSTQRRRPGYRKAPRQ